MTKTDFIDEFLNKYENLGRLRTLKNLQAVSADKITIDNREYVNFSSNDYLGLGDLNSDINKELQTGALSSRLVCGNLDLNTQLENKISKWKGSENCLLLNSGYQANVGLIPALADRHTLIFSDKLNHASIIDGIKLSGAKNIRFRHNDITHLKELLNKYKNEEVRKIIISETLFSMDGDYCDIDTLVKLSKEHNSLLYLDDAHGSGLLGSKGIGICENKFEDIDIYMGTFGKAHGSFGAFTCCSSKMKRYLINKVRTLIFSTGLPPSLLSSNLSSIDKVINANSKRLRLQESTNTIRKFLNENKIATIESESPIIPIIIGEDKDSLSLSEHLKKDGIIAVAIRPPTVPEGTARIRLTVTASHTDEDIKQLLSSLKRWQSNAG
ncbi:MAG: aminotransferase class I/II-fold pyridoxal phosphate-dependent enzyme [Lentisphaerales bacterium]|nr:aminotransferase class I/II-fold pyridoxal phosphate-dependent enzyme [Lentisphaerales bacterium]